MPYKTISDLPATFNNLPDEAKQQAMAVINDLLDKKEPEASAIAQAWGAVKKTWEQDKDGKWVKKEKKLNELATVDIDDVEILAAGKWHGHPRDVELTAKDLQAAVESFNELIANAQLNYEPPVKLGHDEKQKLLQADGYPAAGWIGSLRVNGDKLVASLKKVPAKVAEIINAGGYKKISSEINSNYEIGGKTYPWVLRAVSLLGADIPAVKSISDIAALYHEQDGGSLFVFYEPSLDRQSQSIRDAYYAAFPPREALMPLPSEYVRDIFADTIIVERGKELWQIPYSTDESGVHFDLTKAIQVEQVYQPVATTAAEAPATSVAEETIKGTEVKMEKELRAMLGLDEKGDVLAAVTALKSKAEANTVTLTEQESLKTKLSEAEVKLTEAQSKIKTSEVKLAERERDDRVSKALQSGKIIPALKGWAEQYALTDPAGFDAFVAAAPKAIQLGEKGAEGGDPAETQLTEEEIDIARKTGVDLAKLKASKAAEAAKSKK